MNQYFDRAQLLIEQGRFSMAEEELRRALITDPQNAVMHATLALAMRGQAKMEGALAEAQAAIVHGPDVGFCHYVHAAVLKDLKRYEEAQAAMEEAIRIVPHDADYWGLLAALHAIREQWTKTLEAADTGLGFDPSHEGCVNLRTMALVHLNRREEAGQTVEGALERDPDSAFTHANMGWTLLHKNEPGKAMEHFREALRLEPGLEWARQGVLEALKARNFLYRGFLMYGLWLTRLSPTVRWGVVIGMVVVMQVISHLPAEGAARWVVLGLLLAYFLFALTVWTAVPLFNLLLRLDRMGRLILNDDERRDTNWMALALVVIATLTGSAAWQGMYGAAVTFLMLGILTGVTLSVPRTGRRSLAGLIALGIFGVAGLYWYGWYAWPYPFSPLDIGAANKYVNEFPEKLDNIEASYGRQILYQKIVMWGTAGMTWLAPMFDRRR